MDCTQSCRHPSHAYAILSAITREDLSTFKTVLRRLCSNPANLTDEHGRHAIHVAASCGKKAILEWLIEECKINVEIKDQESGWTALHRSLFYGQLTCAEVLLQFSTLILQANLMLGRSHIHAWRRRFNLFQEDMKHGADLYALDKEELTPLDLLLQDSPFKLSTSVDAKVVANYDTKLDDELCLHVGDIVTNIHMSGSSYWTGNLGNTRGFFPKSCVELIRQDYRSDLFTWGANTNFTLGHQDESLRQNPEIIEIFSSDKTISIIQVAMCKFHSVFLCQDGSVFTCGHGRGGRLGHNNEQTQLAPKKVDGLKDHHCVAIAAAHNHTLIVTESGMVFTFGLNDMHQLGHSPAPAQCLTPRMIQIKSWRGKHMIGASAGQYHSVLHTHNEVYTCGLNIGQLGQLKGEKFITTPRQVTSLYHKDITIARVACSDSASICATSKGDIFVLSQYSCQKVITRFLELTRLLVSGGDVELNTNQEVIKCHEKLTLTLLNANGMVHYWKDSFGTIRRCKWLSRKEILVADIAVGKQLYIITDTGELYSCLKAGGDAPIVKPRSSSSSPTQERDWDQKDVIRYDVKRCPMVHRGIRIFTDKKSKGFAVLQVDPLTGTNKHPVVSQSTMCNDFKQLLEETVIEDDIHDVDLVVQEHIIPAHRFILASKSPKFHHILVKDNEVSEFEEEVTRTVELDGVEYHVMIKYLQDLYTGYMVDDTLLFGNKTRPKTTKNITNQSQQQHVDHVNGSQQESDTLSEVLQGFESLSLPDLDDFSTLTKSTNDADLVENSLKKNKKKLEKNGICAKGPNRNNKNETSNQKNALKGLKFKRKNCPELHDVIIESEDGVQFQCHKCVLIARLDYFRSMLVCGWLETSKEIRVLNMPIHSSVLQVVLDYLYTDGAEILKGHQNIEFIGNVLVVADQLLIGRLREICETALAKLISQRNVTEVLEFSCVYNADQLKESCFEFICNNLGSLLEAGYLGLLNEETLNLLTKAYKEAIPRMPWRIITPQFDHVFALSPEPSSSPSKRRRSSGRKRSVKSESETEGDPKVASTQDNENCEQKANELTADVVFEIAEAENEGEENDRDEAKSEASEVHEEDEEEVNGVLSSQNQSEEGKWYRKITDTFDNHHPPKPTSPSKTHASRDEKTMASKPKEIPKTKPQEQPSIKCPWVVAATSPPSSGLRAIMEQELLTTPTSAKVKSPTAAKVEIKGKQSQKQRKKAKLLQEKEKENSLEFPEKNEMQQIAQSKGNTTPPVNPWAIPDKNPTPVRSLRELIEQEEKSERILSKSSINASPSKVNSKTQDKMKDRPINKTKMSWGVRHLEHTDTKKDNCEDVTEPTSPKNAWQTSDSSSPPPSVSFADILHLQERENTNLQRKKALNLIQLEDRAIQELLDHYGGRDNACEMVTVERVATKSAAPLWHRERTESSVKS